MGAVENGRSWPIRAMRSRVTQYAFVARLTSHAGITPNLRVKGDSFHDLYNDSNTVGHHGGSELIIVDSPSTAAIGKQQL